MRWLVVYCHPLPDSFCAAIRDTAVAALKKAGYQVDLLDLYAEGFDPVMPATERRRYNQLTMADHPVPVHAGPLKAADAILFIYPTWWYGMPAILKGWLDRVWTPDLAFCIPDAPGPVEPLMTHVKSLGVITTYGAPRWWIWFVGQPGRHTILRGMRALCARKCQRLFLALYQFDNSTPEKRSGFLRTIEKRLARF